MITICTFDLETTSLNADFGVLLCAVIKPSHGKPIIFRADELNKQWDTKRSNDKAIVQAVASELTKYDCWLAHNGLRFDVPFLRTRIARWKLPPLPDSKLIDPVQLARNKLKLSYNSLERIAGFLGVNHKTVVDGDLWLRAALDGDRKAMNYIVDHCVKDVSMLEDIVDAVKAYSKTFNSWGSGYRREDSRIHEALVQELPQRGAGGHRL
jgi:uncharacterized protein YprB with RNaseH-like and TPR domain